MKVVIVGSGAVAAEITSYIIDNNSHVGADSQIDILGYLEFEENIERYWKRYRLKQPVLGDVHSYHITADVSFIIGISHLEFRQKMIDVLETRNGNITGFTHYTSIVDSSATLGIGNIIYPQCIIGPNCVIGNHNLITSQSMISHDCVVGNNNFFSTAVLCGGVQLANDNFFGVKATVLPKITIGSQNIIQAGMMVDKDMQDNQTIFYRFKEKVLAIPK